MDLLADRFTCPLRTLSICSGIGGASLGLSLALGKHHVTVCHVEREAPVAAILAARMEEGKLDPAPIFSSLQSFDPKPWCGAVDLIVSTAPCQSYSVAGKRQGSADKEKHLWPYIAEIIKDIRPALFFLENVPGIVTTALPEICQDLCGMGFTVACGVFSAAEVGAPHHRRRLFLLAADPRSGPIHEQCRGIKGSRWKGAVQPRRYGATQYVANANGQSIRIQSDSEGKTTRHPEVQSSCDGASQFLADADGKRCIKRRTESTLHVGGDGIDGGCSSKIKSDEECDAVGGVGGLAAGLSQELARYWGQEWEAETPRVAVNQAHREIKLRALGNAVVPATACKAFLCLLQQHIDGDNLLSASSG